MSVQVQQFDCSVDLLKALLWQHDNAEKLKALVAAKQAWYRDNQCDFWGSWYRDVFNLDTANEFGLSVWSRILGLPLQVRIEGSRSKDAFGFGSSHRNFGNGNFARGQSGEQSLSSDQARTALKMRYFQLVSRGSVTEINEWLRALFGNEGGVFVSDSGDMTLATYFFSFAPSSQLKFILEKYDLLPRPAAVGVEYQIQVRPSWGFGTNHLNFENGNFGA
jgi:hypothetical protein